MAKRLIPEQLEIIELCINLCIDIVLSETKKEG
nr:MAG TPA: hypothetical protein [Caudoviricetes sp.]